MNLIANRFTEFCSRQRALQYPVEVTVLDDVLDENAGTSRNYVMRGLVPVKGERIT
jgi:hypothetical protein